MQWRWKYTLQDMCSVFNIVCLSSTAVSTTTKRVADRKPWKTWSSPTERRLEDLSTAWTPDLNEIGCVIAQHIRTHTHTPILCRLQRNIHVLIIYYSSGFCELSSLIIMFGLCIWFFSDCKVNNLSIFHCHLFLFGMSQASKSLSLASWTPATVQDQ